MYMGMYAYVCREAKRAGNFDRVMRLLIRLRTYVYECASMHVYVLKLYRASACIAT
jgi:hypothetical protein